MSETTDNVGIDGKTYWHPEDGEFGWRFGNHNSGEAFITDGVSVLRCEGVDYIDEDSEEELACVFDEWLEMIKRGEEGYSKVV